MIFAISSRSTLGPAHRDHRVVNGAAAYFQDKHAKTILRQIGSKRSAARAGADDDEIVLC